MDRKRVANIVLRVGVAFALVYPPLAALYDPTSWVGYLPRFARALPVSLGVLLHAFGVAEIILALWILFGKNIRIPSWCVAAMLFLIVIFNANQFNVVFRDISIALMAIALGFL